MKKSITKRLQLNTEVIVSLTDEALTHAKGALGNGTYLYPCTGIICSGYTGRCSGGSGCSDCQYCPKTK